jgi:predicted RNA binding protein YcfA (HicA-like mRNA interferase family)
MKSADIIRLLERSGWALANVCGSHHVFRHPDKLGHISVPHPKKDLGTGLVKKLLRQAGLEENHEISDCH